MRKLGRTMAVAALALVGGCNGNPASIANNTSEDILGRQFVDAVRGDEQAALDTLVADNLKADDARPVLTKLHSILGGAEAPEMVLIGWHVLQKTGEGKSATVTYQLQRGGDYAMLTMREVTVDNRLVVAGVQFDPLPNDLRRLHAIDFWHKGADCYFFLLAQTGMLGLMVFTLVACARMRIPRRKWLWMLFILCGAGKLDLNWTTGEMAWQTLVLHVPIVGWDRESAYGPLVAWFTVPVGALVFLVWRADAGARAVRDAARAAAAARATALSTAVAAPDASPTVAETAPDSRAADGTAAQAPAEPTAPSDTNDPHRS